jgi:hypothetical protein
MYGHALKRLGMKEESLTFWKKVLVEEPGNEVARNEVEKLLNPDVSKAVDTPTVVPPLNTSTTTLYIPTITPVDAKNNATAPDITPSTNIKDPVMNK